MQAGDVQGGKADGRADYINNGVDGAHLMEMDGIHRLAMHLGLGLGQQGEDGKRRFLDRFREVACGDELPDIPQGAVRMALGGLDREGGGGDGPAGLFAHGQGIAVKAKQGQLAAQLLDRQPGIEQGAKEHVAADPGKTVDIGDGAVVSHFFSGGPGLLVPLSGKVRLL